MRTSTHTLRRRASTASGTLAGFLLTAALLAGVSTAFAERPTAGVPAKAPPLSAHEVAGAEKAATKHRQLAAVLAKNGVRRVTADRVPGDSEPGDEVLLTYELVAPLRGRSEVFGRQTGRAGTPHRLTVPVIEAKVLDVVVDPGSGEVESVMPGLGTRYGRPAPGDTVPLADGSVYTLTGTNFVYHEDIAAVELLDLDPAE